PTRAKHPRCRIVAPTACPQLQTRRRRCRSQSPTLLVRARQDGLFAPGALRATPLVLALRGRPVALAALQRDLVCTALSPSEVVLERKNYLCRYVVHGVSPGSAISSFDTAMASRVCRRGDWVFLFRSGSRSQVGR